MTPEGRVKAITKKAIARLVYPGTNDHSCVYSFMPVQRGMGAPALDFYYCINGTFVAIETKAPGKKMTPRQEHTTACIRGADGIVLEVATKDDLARAIAAICKCCGVEYGPPIPRPKRHAGNSLPSE